MKIEQFRYGPKHNRGLYFEQTDGVSTLLPETEIARLYNFGNRATKELRHVEILKIGNNPEIMAITFAGPTADDHGRATTFNHTFLVSVAELAPLLVKALEQFVHDVDRLEPLKVDSIPICEG